MHINIRWAKQSDCDEIHRLVVELARFEKAGNEVVTTPLDFLRDGFVNDPSFKAFVCEANDEIVGICLFHTAYSTWKGKYIYLDDLIVKEECRRKGLGKMLFDRLIEYCAEIEVKQLRWHVLDWNKDAIKFYGRYGATLDSSWVTGKLSEEQLKQLSGLNESI